VICRLKNAIQLSLGREEPIITKRGATREGGRKKKKKNSFPCRGQSISVAKNRTGGLFASAGSYRGPELKSLPERRESDDGVGRLTPPCVGSVAPEIADDFANLRGGAAKRKRIAV